MVEPATLPRIICADRGLIVLPTSTQLPDGAKGCVLVIGMGRFVPVPLPDAATVHIDLGGVFTVPRHDLEQAVISDGAEEAFVVDIGFARDGELALGLMLGALGVGRKTVEPVDPEEDEPSNPMNLRFQKSKRSC